MKKLILGLMLAALGANAELVDINGAKVERNTPYDIVDGESGTVGEFLDVGGFAMQTNVYDKSEMDAKIDAKVSSLDFYKKSEVDAKIADEGVKRQDGDTAAINSAKTYIDDKLKTYEASPNYAVVSNAAMTALQPPATNALANANEVYKKTETYTQTEIDTKIAAATPSDYEAVKSQVAANETAIATHTSDTSNPHDVTAAQVGALTSESDPSFFSWKNNIVVLAGKYAAAPLEGDTAIGREAKVGGKDVDGKLIFNGTALGAFAYCGHSDALAVRQTPSLIYLMSDVGDLGASARTLQSYLDERATTNALADVKASIPVISATDATFSNAVLAVGLNIDTDSVAVLNEIAKDFGGFPLSAGETATTVGGLLAALAAGLAALKKSVSTLSSKVDDANAALEEVA